MSRCQQMAAFVSLGLFVQLFVPSIALGHGTAVTPLLEDLLRRAGDLVRQYQLELPRVIGTETMLQLASPPRWDGARMVARRELVAELAWVTERDQPEAIGIRDVVQLDGRALVSERTRLQELLNGDAISSGSEVRAILNEAARFNLGSGSRNFNLPTLALFFLHPDVQPRFKWSRQAKEHATDWTVVFTELKSPTLIRDGDRPAFSRGEVVIDGKTGAIRRTTLNLDLPGLSYRLVATFADVVTMPLPLPATLEEHYDDGHGEVTSKAHYDHYRRFESAARLLDSVEVK